MSNKDFDDSTLQEAPRQFLVKSLILAILAVIVPPILFFLGATSLSAHLLIASAGLFVVLELAALGMAGWEISRYKDGVAVQSTLALLIAFFSGLFSVMWLTQWA